MRLTRDRWYSKDSQRQLYHRARNEATGLRKVASLVLLLLMVLLAMQQMSDPRKYEPGFRAVGLTQAVKPQLATPPDTSIAVLDKNQKPQSKTSNDLASSMAGAKNSIADLFNTPENSNVDLLTQMWQRLFEGAPEEVIQELAKVEFSSTPRVTAERAENSATIVTASTDASPPPVKPSQAALDWLSSSQDRIGQWKVEYQSVLDSNKVDSNFQNSDVELGMKFVSQWSAWASLTRNGIVGASSAFDLDLRTALRLALDQSLLEILKDAAPWRSQERPTLARSLQRAQSWRSLPDSGAESFQDLMRATPLVEVTSLIKQTDEYRGQVVRLRGQPLTNPDSVAQDIEGWGRFQYELVWFRPDDSSQQPVCVYAIHSPSGGWPLIKSVSDKKSNSVKSVPHQAIDSSDAPMAELTGILIKRLAYPSLRGIDVAPVLVVFDIRWLSEISSLESDTHFIRSSKFRKHRWIEPGERTANLNLLREILGSDLESMSDEKTQSRLTSDDFVMDVEAEVPQLVQLLYQLPRIERPLSIAIATEQSIGPCRLTTLDGWVREIVAIRLAKTPSPTDEPRSIYRLRIEAQDNPAALPTKHYVFVNQIPKEWQTSTEISQPVSLHGLNWEHASPDRPQCWIAGHMRWSWAWLAGEASPIQEALNSDMFVPGIAEDWQDLGAAGFDLGHIQLLQSLRGKPITSDESRAFYSIIDCANRLPKVDVERAKTVFSTIDCLREKDAPMLRRVRTRVEIVRATRIIVSDEFDQAELGGDAYFELDGLAKLQGMTIQMKSPEGKEDLFFQDEYPITLISKQIPIWLVEPELSDAVANQGRSSEHGAETQNAPTVWYPRMSMEVEGFFYRLWSFNTAQTTSANRSIGTEQSGQARLRQIGPLVAVTHWEKPLLERPAASNRSIIRETITAIGLLLVCIYGYYRLRPAPRRKKPMA
ncbi:MAG: hypothetical protein SGI77_12935 [Pirellulaceae bacterium]|nr:hypothetical protein [Pirellulaceae bacterium]